MMKKIPICLAIEKQDLQILQKKAREQQTSVQSFIRVIITNKLKKLKNEQK